ncbi:hypothetical protein NCCP1664_28620 [Zafaria cholistanensis]|uniref:Cell division protein FtsL n=1 Tax=Zafaria cholistanensis TaxID=1682741 RepID=A0A5A7NVT3_9MICC|nr:hypothetical protein [Zafaria cholistanensis]GER24367.1 hypothetical protein NCCP1664_28620 [Zafaria cholistanensis]
MGIRTQTGVEPHGIPASAVDGATARALVPEPRHDAPEPRRRTALSVVPAVVGGRRLQFALFCFAAMLAAALATVLVLNISVSGGQYEVVKLRNQEQALVQENEALAQQAQKLEAPQSVAAKAAELGMVVPGSVASIDLETLKVAGTSSEAKAEESPTSLVADRETAARDTAARDTAARDTAVGAGASAAEPAAPPAETAGTAPAEEGTPATGPVTGTEPAGERLPAGGVPARIVDTEFTEQELNGGTIPAPAQQQPKN